MDLGVNNTLQMQFLFLGEHIGVIEVLAFWIIDWHGELTAARTY